MRTTTDLVARCDCVSRVAAFGRRDGDDFRADHREDHHHDGGEDCAHTLREEAAVRVQVGQALVMTRP